MGWALSVLCPWVRVARRRNTHDGDTRLLGAACAARATAQRGKEQQARGAAEQRRAEEEPEPRLWTRGGARITPRDRSMSV